MKLNAAKTSQDGVMLIEALIAILIFSVGVLGIIGLQGSAVKASVDAKYRSEAALLANELIGRMWASDRTQATLQTAYSSATDGLAFKQWAYEGTVVGSPGVITNPKGDTVLAKLPGAASKLPTVEISPDIGTAKPSSTIKITIFWQVPGETGSHHQYVALAQIGG